MTTRQRLLESHDPKYSPNIRRWLLHRIQEDVTELKAWRGVNERVIVGYVFDGDIIGASLGEVMAINSRIAQNWWFGLDMPEIPGWWDSYEKEGRCFTDPKHAHHAERWATTGAPGQGSRVCDWCGLKQRELSFARVVMEKRWVDEFNCCGGSDEKTTEHTQDCSFAHPQANE